MKGKLLTMLLATSITACTTVTSSNTANKIVVCESPRSQICTMDYRPVCGLMAEKLTKTYSNGCAACSNPKVISYTDQACNDGVSE